jgi:hypothetical protein
MIMLTRLLTAGFATAVALSLAAPASATTIDFSSAGTNNGDIVAQTYGDSAEADLSYRTLEGGSGSIWGQTAPQSDAFVRFWAGNYSGDQAIYAAQTTHKLELSLAAGAGLHFTSVTFHLGGYPDSNKTTAFRLYDASWNELLSNDTLLISGTTGALVTLAVNTTTLYFQMGDDYNTGVTSLDFATSTATTPVPPALLLLLTAIGGVGLAGWRKKLSLT